MRSARLLTPGTIRGLQRATFTLGGAVAFFGAILLAARGIAQASQARATAERRAVEVRRGAALEVIASARATPEGTPPDGVPPEPQGVQGALDAFQGGLAAACVGHGVRLVSFESTTDPQPAATRYGGPAPTAGGAWRSVDAKVQLRGRLTDVYTVIADLKSCPTPFEIASLGLEGDARGGVRVTLAAAVLTSDRAPATPGGGEIAHG